MPDRASDAPPRQLTGSRRPAVPARAAARPVGPARPLGAGRHGPDLGPAVCRDRGGPAGRRAGPRRPARAVRCAGACRGRGLRRGAARPAGGRWPRGLDRPARRAVRAGAAGARPGSGPADRGPGAGPGRPSLGAGGGLAQPRPGCGAGRGRPAHPDPEPPAAARRRGQRRDRLFAPPAGRRASAERGVHPLADRGARRRGRWESCVPGPRPALLAGRAVPLPWRAVRQLADRLVCGRLA